MNEKEIFAIGVDFGTTQSRIAIKRRDEQESLRLVSLTPRLLDAPSDLPAFTTWYTDEGNSMPSVVAVKVPTEGTVRFLLEIKVGAEAQMLPVGYRTFTRFKRLIGRGDRYKQDRLYQIGKDQDGEDFLVCPEGLAGSLIGEMLKTARPSPGLQHLDAVNVTVTVPARSTIGQRMATQFAAALAGFRGEISVLEEPVAVFLYYYYTHPEVFRREKDGYALVFDFGGGTCDISIIRYQLQGLPLVITRQMGEFGGEDIDDLIARLWLGRVRGRPGYSLEVLEKEKPYLVDKLRIWARWAKEQLHNVPTVPVAIPEFDPDHPGSFHRVLRRQDITKLLWKKPVASLINGSESQAPIMAMIDQMLDNALTETRLRDRDINLILLAGGSSHLHEVQRHISQRFADLGKEHILFDNPGVSVAYGAAIHQFYRHHKNRDLRRVITPTLSSDVKLVYYHNPDTNEQREILLGEKGARLPINCLRPSLHPRGGEKWLTDAEAVDGKILIRITQQAQKLHEDEISVGTRRAQHMRVRYRINEYGILENLECTPANVLQGLFSERLRLARVGLEGRMAGTGINLADYSVTNQDRIDSLRLEYGIQVHGEERS